MLNIQTFNAGNRSDWLQQGGPLPQYPIRTGHQVLWSGKAISAGSRRKVNADAGGSTGALPASSRGASQP